MFRGTYEHAIDGKGRTSFPSKFREVLAGQGDSRLILTTGFDPCVLAYPMRTFTAFEEKLMALSQFDRAVKDLRRVYIHNAVECEVDSVGRILIPPSLREHADLKREAVWAGNGNNVELWAKERHVSVHKDIFNDEDRLESAQKRLTEIGL